jgi:hypothetical protein
LAAASAGSSTAGAAGDAVGSRGDSEDIRAVDFGDIAQPGSACREGLRFTAPSQIPVQGGQSRLLDLGRLTQLNVDSDVAYGDVNGDGVDDAVVHVVCTFGASGGEDSVHAWTLGNNGPTLLASIDEAPEALAGGDFAPRVEDVSVTDGQVTVTWSHHAEGDPNCCPSQETAVSYSFAGNKLQPTG